VRRKDILSMFVKVQANGLTYHLNVAYIVFAMEVGDTLEVQLEGRTQPFRFSDQEAKTTILEALVRTEWWQIEDSAARERLQKTRPVDTA
jgi:hypothetical protein